MGRIYLEMVKNTDTPLALRLDLFDGLDWWFNGTAQEAVNELKSITDDFSKMELWVTAQFGLARMFRKALRDTDAKQRLNVCNQAEVNLSHIIGNLVVLFYDNKHNNRTIKTMAIYKSMLGQRFAHVLVDELRKDKTFSRLRHLLLLKEMCIGVNWRSTEIVAYANEMKQELSMEGKKASEEEKEIVEKLLTAHVLPAGSPETHQTEATEKVKIDDVITSGKHNSDKAPPTNTIKDSKIKEVSE